MINNFDKIIPLLSFESEDVFYFCQILQRKKDNPDGAKGSNNSSRLVKAYYITSVEKLLHFKEEMIFFAEHFNARVGINLNKRSFYKTSFNTMKTMAEQMHNKAFTKVHRAWNTSCGVHNGGDRIWLLDVDNIENPDILDVFDNPEVRRELAIRGCINKSLPVDKNKILAKLPTKNGYHIITTPFDTREFRTQFPEIEIHKNNPVNLYIP